MEVGRKVKCGKFEGVCKLAQIQHRFRETLMKNWHTVSFCVCQNMRSNCFSVLLNFNTILTEVPNQSLTELIRKTCDMDNVRRVPLVRGSNPILRFNVNYSIIITMVINRSKPVQTGTRNLNKCLLALKTTRRVPWLLLLADVVKQKKLRQM